MCNKSLLCGVNVTLAFIRGRKEDGINRLSFGVTRGLGVLISISGFRSGSVTMNFLFLKFILFKFVVVLIYPIRPICLEYYLSFCLSCLLFLLSNGGGVH